MIKKIIPLIEANHAYSPESLTAMLVQARLIERTDAFKWMKRLKFWTVAFGLPDSLIGANSAWLGLRWISFMRTLAFWDSLSMLEANQTYTPKQVATLVPGNTALDTCLLLASKVAHEEISNPDQWCRPGTWWKNAAATHLERVLAERLSQTL